MKRLFLIIAIGLFIIVSCKKEKLDTRPVQISPPPINHTPIADAGKDQTIVLPNNSVNLNGRGSLDPGSNIVGYSWGKISGPSSFTISDSSLVETTLLNLVEGVYLIELKVTDAEGLFDKDTVEITVTHLPVEHLIDMVFDINPECKITGDYPAVNNYADANFELSASRVSSPGSDEPHNAHIDQGYERYSTDYFYQATLMVGAVNGSIGLNFSLSQNFYTLSYNAGASSFSDSVVVTRGDGVYTNIVPGARLFCSGTADTTHHTGSIRLTGSVFY